MVSRVPGTKYTFSAVLGKLFRKEQLGQGLGEEDFSTGTLCTPCKDSVINLFRLQQELREVKNGVVSTYLNSLKSCKGKVEQEEEKASKEKSKKRTPDDNAETPRKKKKVADEDQVPEEEVYIIESLKEKSGDKYLVKWENYSEDENTWEPRSSIPDYVLQVS